MKWECCPLDDEKWIKHVALKREKKCKIMKMKMEFCKQGPQLVANPNGKGKCVLIIILEFK